jgi:hypothetical protein
MTERRDLARARGDVDLTTREREQAVREKEVKIEAAQKLVELVLRGGQVFLEIRKQRADSDAIWEGTRRTIAELDASTDAEIRKLEAELSHVREGTERLRLLLNYAASKPDLPDVMHEAIARAVTATFEGKR